MAMDDRWYPSCEFDVEAVYSLCPHCDRIGPIDQICASVAGGILVEAPDIELDLIFECVCGAAWSLAFEWHPD